ncbi:MAG: YbaB/EbfC family nucleoid-associated protein [Bacilli bacterium]|nr:YbaB/EbfC family nucleoid-associated protein [Bacilli bacterium]
MNMSNLMAQAQKMQKDIQKKQQEINEMKFIGCSEWVDVELMGDKTISKINIKNKITMDEEDLECLEDMIKIAINDAYEKIDKEIEKKLGMYSKMAGGLF